MIRKEDIVRAGRIERTHGLAGELVCSLDERYAALLEGAATEYIILEMDEIPVPFFIESRWLKSETTLLLTLEGIGDEQRARVLTGKDIYLERKLLPEELEDDLTLEDLIGYHLVDAESGQDLGVIENIDDSTMNILFCLADDRLVPAADDLIEEIDTDKKQVFGKYTLFL